MTDRDDERVVALAREVERATRRVGELDTLVRQLGEDVTRLLDAETVDDDRPPLPSWLAVVDSTRARAMLADLADWLTRVYLRHPDAALPACWAWHPSAVEELLWLRRAHAAAYEGRGASWRDVGDFHDRLRPGVVRRLHEAIGSCELALHTSGGDADLPAPTVPLADALGWIAELWTTDRTSPEPTNIQLTAAEQHDRAQHRPAGTR